MDLALFVEDTFGVRIEDTELNANTFDNLNQLASLVASRKV
jgi:acyl carrier protein